jgi:8-oxo-dGTP diphosphatase
VIRVVAAVIERGGRILICQRRAGDPMAGKWEFPGGKIRRSETPRAALARELREEIGVEANIGDAIYRARHRYAEFATRLEITFFGVRAFFGAPRNLVFQRIVWARRADLSRRDFLAADRVLVSRLIRGQL